MSRAGCSLGASCYCIGRAHGPGCRMWSADLDADIARANERTAAERVVPAPSVRYCDFHCIASKTVVVVHHGTVVCDGSCSRRSTANTSRG